MEMETLMGWSIGRFLMLLINHHFVRHVLKHIWLGANVTLIASNKQHKHGLATYLK